MLRTQATSDVADGIKVDGASSIIHSVTGECNTSNIDEVKQTGTTSCTDSIKEERDMDDMEETISYNSCGTERQECDRASGGSEAKGVETTGNLFLKIIF